MDGRRSSGETFGTNLLRSVPSITARHDEEVKLLESLYQHMTKRAKADMDYAAQLTKINAAAVKACPKDSKGEVSSIMQIWSVFLQATDKVISKINHSAQQMRSLLSTELQPLIKNKRGAGVAFTSDRVKAENDYTVSSRQVDALHQQYKDNAKVANKCKRKMKKSNEKTIQQYTEASSNLHNCHNTYILAIHNANTHQHYYKTSLLPLAFDTFQERMELHVGEWKAVLEKYTNSLDMHDVYEDANNMITSALSRVSPATEYATFIHQHKSKDSLKMASYDFDASVAKIPSNRVANPGVIAINNLTMNSLREKLSELNKTVDSLRKQISYKESDIENVRRDLASCDSKKLMKIDTDRYQQLTIRMSIVQGELEKLRCDEACSQAQAELLKQAFEKIGGEGVIPPLFDSSIGDIDLSFLTGDLSSSRSTGSGSGHTLSKLFGFGSKSSKTPPPVPRKVPSLPKVHGAAPIPLIPDGNGSESDDDEDIDEEPWYYGDIPRDDTHQMVKVDGDYLVRFSGNKSCYVTTVKWEGAIKHFAIQKKEDNNGTTFCFEGTTFSSIGKLIKHYRDNRMPVTKRTQAILKKPICKITVADDEYTMRHDDIVLDRQPLGKGNFGDVFSGTVRSTGVRVAVKTCRSEHIPAAQQFLAEAEILKQYDHPNIVRLLGVCSDKEPVYIVMELMTGGDFLHFLRKHGINQSAYQLTKFSLDAARGMEYLASKNCIHRDLAARNCLVGDNNEIMKISDFGMSRETDDDNIYLQSSGCKPVPVKWTAPESLNLGQYTSASDVWSYGVLLFETFSCGSSPYPGMSNAQARESVEQGYRMEPPEGTPREVYDQVMWPCWYFEPDDRPTFSEVVIILQGIISKMPKK